jgi:F-type H+-transporting ATPase subunit epsilon
MADSFSFELVSPERLLLSASATEVVLPATEGEMTVMAEHAPFMTTIRPGVVTVKEASGVSQAFVVFGGFADILPTGCTLLAESALPVSEFHKDQLAKRLELANADFANASDDDSRRRLSQLVSDLKSLEAIVA